MVRLFVVLTSAILMMASPAWAQNGRPVHLSAESVLLLAPDGTVLFAKNPSEDHAPASLVKLMTLYLACEDLETGRVAWEEPVAISRRAAETPRYRMGLRAGDSVPFRTLLEGVAIASANDAATAVAEHLAGTEEAFVERMNAKEVLRFGFADAGIETIEEPSRPSAPPPPKRRLRDRRRHAAVAVELPPAPSRP